MVIVVSTFSTSLSRPSSAMRARREPSNANGLIAVATVSAPICFASDAITGAAPVPVPPPKPVTRKTMSASPSSSVRSSVFSKADCFPTSGFEPVPWPWVVRWPICNLVVAEQVCKACSSVFTAT